MVKILYERFISRTPKMFAMLRNFGIALTLVSTNVLAMPDYYIDWVVPYAKYGITIGAIISFLSQLTTVEDKNDAN